MGTAFLTGQGAKKVALIGDAVVTDVIVGKTFYKDDPDTQLVGTLALTGDSGVGDVLAGKTFYKDDPTTQLTGTLALIGDAVAAEVLSGKKFYKDDAKTQLTGTMTNKVGSATVITPSTADQTIPQGYYGGDAGDGKVAGDADLVAGNIKDGVTIFGVDGTLVDGTNMKHYATGTGTSNVSKVCTVTGLNFHPSIVLMTINGICYYLNPDVSNNTCYANNGSTYPYQIYAGTDGFILTCAVASAGFSYKAWE